ncbi:MAG: Crp/Fnr family transcriptional regulator [Pseudomonadota bacterium]
MADQSLVATLQATDVFKLVDDTTLARLTEAMRPVSFKSGQVIFSRGDQQRELYLINTGRVKISVLTAEGRELALAHVTDGGLFGEIAMLDGGLRTADATALSDTKAHVLTTTAFENVLHDAPDLAKSLIVFLCHRLRETDRQIEAIALHRIDIRLARYLVAICRQLEPGCDDGEITFELGVPQGELALLLGASRPKVNGALISLEEQGVIERKGNRLTCRIGDLLDIAELD